MMKYIAYISIILLIFAISCKNQDKNGGETNSEQEEVLGSEATMEMTEETIPEDNSTSSEDNSQFRTVR